ncbi:rhomboid family intramembrane serine protease [Parvibaculum sp.]|uniref:rhomboid family intramembrane serine protease n=1 Tax=Parvibaculum sp. TaxID=2024848 RepID=UPI003BAA8CC0
MADPYSSEMLPRREPPAFNVPGAVLMLLVLLFGVQIVAMSLSWEQQEQIILLFSLIPARYLPEIAALQPAYPGGAGADFWTPITYTFLHGGWEHLIVNSVWLLAFGSPVAQRLGATRFFLFYFLCGIAGRVVARSALCRFQHACGRCVGSDFRADGRCGALRLPGGRASWRAWRPCS